MQTGQDLVDEFQFAEMAPLHGFAIHQMSFKETFMDRSLSVIRPGLGKELTVPGAEDTFFQYGLDD